MRDLDKLTIDINGEGHLPSNVKRGHFDEGNGVGQITSYISGHSLITVKDALNAYYETKERIADLTEANENLMRLIEEVTMIELNENEQAIVAAIGVDGIIAQLRINIKSGLPCFNDTADMIDRLDFWCQYRLQQRLLRD